MIIAPELDLTPESAETLNSFRRFFHSSIFAGIALSGGLNSTDLQTLYRVMDCVVGVAAGYHLCSPSDPLTPAERMEAAQAAVEALKTLIAEWYASLTAAQQQAVLDLLRSIIAWLQSVVDRLSPEVQAILEALTALLGILLIRETP
jgi:hypothetical protein